MLIKTIPVGHLETNCYIVTNENTLECAVIDPGDESNTILDYLEDNRLKCKAVLITHGHYDHTGAADTVSEETGAVVYMSKADDKRVMNSNSFVYSLPENGIYFADGDIISAAGLDFEIMATPGHSKGSVTIRCGDALFTGDTLFKGSCGRTDLDGGDTESILRSLKKICSLEGDYEVYPGHMESSTLLREKMLNYYCRLAMSKY
ncbi:MAG: MBL fold metallo-hydrolase [Oscillospiraceae bacterium]|nr:MBL fold metallo-hydrolase [Oscillospiraceae bacterium]